MATIIVGLGNPGDRYVKTRHNIGFMVLDILAQRWNIQWKDEFSSQYGGVTVGSDKIYLMKPMTYMNLSGHAVQALAHYYKVEPENILVIHDELDFEFGIMKFRRDGSSAGHNGIKSIIEMLSTQKFPRLKLGIGKVNRSDLRGVTADYVLSNFDSTEKQALPEFIDKAADAVEYYTKNGLAKAMELYNR